MSLHTWNIDGTWTLFLDRDGVMNEKLEGAYVRNVHEMHLLPLVPEAVAKFNTIFQRTVLVTNQQGIGKGIMTEDELALVHGYLQERLAAAEGRLDNIYYAPQLAAENHPMRKPGIGMAQAAKADFPEIDFAKSIMVGDSVSDMRFGRAAGMKCVFMLNGRNPAEFEPKLWDEAFPNLAGFAQAL